MESDYTFSMDSVRFGRALGVGARAAAKTLVMAVDAATAPNPSAGAKTEEGADASPSAASPGAASPGASSRGAASPGVNPPVGKGKAEDSGVRMPEQVARTAAQVRQTGRGLKQGGKQFNKTVGGRLARLSGALWLELTGVFFGIFAVSAVAGSWRMRHTAAFWWGRRVNAGFEPGNVRGAPSYSRGRTALNVSL